MAKLSKTAKCPRCGGSLCYQDKMASKTNILGTEKTIVKRGSPLYRRIWWCNLCKKAIKVPLYKV